MVAEKSEQEGVLLQGVVAVISEGPLGVVLAREKEREPRVTGRGPPSLAVIVARGPTS